jgi:methionine--tRNA ligase beta chain
MSSVPSDPSVPPPGAAAPAPAPAAAPTAAPANVTIDHFKTVDLRAAKVLEVAEHPNADRLWVLTLDVGELGRRTIVAGLRKDVTREELLGRTIVVVANLAPAKLRGVESQGMLLALRGAERAFPLGCQIDVPPGTRVS